MITLGASRIAITPAAGLPMAGYAGRTLPAAGTHDDLYIRAVAASSPNADSTICVLAADILCVDAALTATIRQRIAQAAGLDPAAIMITATHTHAGPAGLARFPIEAGAESYLGEYNPALIQDICTRFERAAIDAIAHQVPVRLVSGTGQAPGTSANRTNPAGPADNTVPWLRAIDTAGRDVAILFSLACHPTVLGPENTLYSGDLIGLAAHKLEAIYPGGVALGLTGTAGDISTRFTRAARTFEEADRLAENVVRAIQHAEQEPDAADTVVYVREGVTVPLRAPDTPASLRQQLDDARARRRTAADLSGAERRALDAAIEGLEIALHAPAARPMALHTEVQALRLGSQWIAGFPGEMFVAYGLALQTAAQPARVLISSYANDYIGYVPTATTPAGYETSMAIVTTNAGNRLLGALESIIAHR